MKRFNVFADGIPTSLTAQEIEELQIQGIEIQLIEK